jgi:predicted small secreted protein
MFAKLIAVLLLLGSMGLAGCNTMKGLGEDVQAGGQSLENAADKHK